MEANALMDAVASALRTHGYRCTLQAALEGRSGTVYTVPLLAERDGAAVLFDVHAGDVPMDLPASVVDALEDVAAHHAVLCHTGGEPSPVPGIRFWGPADLARLLGEARLAEAAGVPATEPVVAAPEVPVAQSVEDVLPPAFAAPEPSLDLDAFEAMDLDAPTPAETVHAPVFPETMPAEAAPAPAAEPFAYPLLPVLVTHAEAREQARERLFNVSHVTMVLQPVHLFDFECDLMGKGTLRYDTVGGRVQVHGTDKAVVEVDAQAADPAGFTRLADVSGFDADERTLRVGDARADELARAQLTEAHTRTVDVVVEDEEYNISYTEKTKVRPRPDHIRLQHLGVFHRVVWRVPGPNGHVDVDALTGQDVQETLATPDPDTVMLD